MNSRLDPDTARHPLFSAPRSSRPADRARRGSSHPSRALARHRRLGGLLGPEACLSLVLGLLLVPAVIHEAAAAEKATGKLIVKDLLTRPKKPVRLEARLVESGLLGVSGLGGEQLQFSVGGIDVGTSMTGGDGRAFLEYTTRMRGNQVIRVKVVASPRVHATEATGNLASWERRRPILFVELAALLEEPKPSVGLPGVSLQMGPRALPQPVDGAPKNLESLTRYYYNVVYVSRTGNLALETFRDWLKEHKFPQGVPRIVKPEKRALTQLLETFVEDGFSNIKGGIGRTRDFAEVFAERRIRIVVLSEDGEERDFPRKTQWSKDWVEVRKKVQG